jgi:hypothetical protein
MPTHHVKNRDIINSFQLLAKLDDLKGIKGSTKFRLAKIGLMLKSQYDLIIETRNKIAKEAFPEKPANLEKKTPFVPAGTIDQESPNLTSFVKDVDTVLEETSSLDLPTLKASELNLDNNDLPFTVLMGLDWLIIQDLDTQDLDLPKVSA